MLAAAVILMLAAVPVGAQQPAPTIDGARVTAVASTWIALEVPLRRNGDNNALPAIEIGPSVSGPFDAVPAAADGNMTRAMWPRVYYIGSGKISQNSVYYLRVRVDGQNPQVIGPIVTPSETDHAISGVVTAPDGEGLSGITIELTGSRTLTTRTDANGRYWFSVPDGSYVVTAVSDLYTFTPASNQAESLDADQSYSFLAAAQAAPEAAKPEAITIQVCFYTPSPSIEFFGSGGGQGSIVISTLGGCNWTAVSTVPWIVIRSGASGRGVGAVTFAVVANTGAAARSGVIRVAGHAVTVNEAGVPGGPVGGNGFANNCGAADAPEYRLAFQGARGPSVGPPTATFLLTEYYQLENVGPGTHPNLHLVIETPVSPNWVPLGSHSVTHCYSSAGNILIPLPSIPPGVTVNEVLTIESPNPNWLPDLLSRGLYKFISGLPSH
jgi:hypothetical protein